MIRWHKLFVNNLLKFSSHRQHLIVHLVIEAWKLKWDEQHHSAYNTRLKLQGLVCVQSVQDFTPAEPHEFSSFKLVSKSRFFAFLVHVAICHGVALAPNTKLHLNQHNISLRTSHGLKPQWLGFSWTTVKLLIHYLEAFSHVNRSHVALFVPHGDLFIAISEVRVSDHVDLVIFIEFSIYRIVTYVTFFLFEVLKQMIWQWNQEAFQIKY